MSQKTKTNFNLGFSTEPVLCENLKVLVPFNLGECFGNEIYIEIYLKINSNMIIHCMFFWNPSKFPSCQFQAFLAQSMSDQSRSLTDLESSWVGFIRSFLNSSSVKNMHICGIWHIFLNHNHGEQVKALRKNLKKKVLSDTLEPPHSPASVLFFFLFTFQLEETLLVIARF